MENSNPGDPKRALAAALLAELPPLLSIPKAAAALGLGERTLAKLLADRRLTVARVGSRVLIPRSSLIDYLASTLELAQ